MKTFSKIEQLFTEHARACLIYDLSIQRIVEDVNVTGKKLETAVDIAMTQLKVMKYIENELSEYPKHWTQTVWYVMSLRKP